MSHNLSTNLSILIPSRNRYLEVEETLRRIQSYAKLRHCPIMVYDDASDQPENYEDLCEEFSDLQIIKGQTRSGQAKARNVLLESAKTSFALFMDDDVRPQEIDSIENTIFQLKNNTNIGIIAPHVSVDYSQYLNHPKSETPRLTGDLKLFCGSAFFCNREILLGLRGFREFFVYGMEEPEFSLRILGNQFRIVADSTLSFVHEHSPSARNDEEYYYLYSRNTFLMYALNFPYTIGIPYGLSKSLAWWLRRPNYRLSRWKGLFYGFKDLMKYRAHRRSLGWQFSLKYIQTQLPFHNQKEEKGKQ